MSKTYLRVRLCQLFPGWTLEEADRVIANENDLRSVLAVINAQNKVRQLQAEQNNRGR